MAFGGVLRPSVFSFAASDHRLEWWNFYPGDTFVLGAHWAFVDACLVSCLFYDAFGYLFFI